MKQKLNLTDKELVSYLIDSLKKIKSRLSCIDNGVNDEGDTQIIEAWKIAFNTLQEIEN